MNRLNAFCSPALVSLLLILSVGCKQDPEAEKEAVLRTLDHYAAAWKVKEIKQFERIFSTGPDLAIYEVRQVFMGWEEWEKRLSESFGSVENVEVHFKDTHVYLSENAAWITTIEDATWLDGGEPREVNDMRVTWGLRKEKGEWKIIQGHWSIPQ
jgi:ketosteroid isomerase-like protein